MATIKHSIEIEVTNPAEVKLIKALLDKYIFSAQGVKQLDDNYNNGSVFVKPIVRGLMKNRHDAPTKTIR